MNKKRYGIHTHTHTHTQWNITQPLKSNEIMSFAATCMEPEIIILSDISQRQIYMISLICGI